MRSGALACPAAASGRWPRCGRDPKPKGEVVPAGEFWSGLPAAASSTVDGARSAFGLAPAVEGEFGGSRAPWACRCRAWKLFAAKARGDGDAAKLFGGFSGAQGGTCRNGGPAAVPFEAASFKAGEARLGVGVYRQRRAGHHSRLAPRRRADAVAAVRKARVLLVAKHLEVDEDNAKAVLRAARAGDEGRPPVVPRRPGPRRPGAEAGAAVGAAGTCRRSGGSRAAAAPGRERHARRALGVLGSGVSFCVKFCFSQTRTYNRQNCGSSAAPTTEKYVAQA